MFKLIFLFSLFVSVYTSSDLALAQVVIGTGSDGIKKELPSYRNKYYQALESEFLEFINNKSKECFGSDLKKSSIIEIYHQLIIKDFFKTVRISTKQIREDEGKSCATEIDLGQKCLFQNYKSQKILKEIFLDTNIILYLAIEYKVDHKEAQKIRKFFLDFVNINLIDMEKDQEIQIIKEYKG